MSRIEWSEDFNTGIHIIDVQHRRIVEYINQLDDVADTHERGQLMEVLVNLIDYTLSHFAFEESLMEEAGYEASSIHKKTHDAFRNRIQEIRQRFDAGEDVADELSQLLNTWLIGHIADDDGSYVPYVKRNMPEINTEQKMPWIRNKILEFFK